jgi:hypothetical protein
LLAASNHHGKNERGFNRSHGQGEDERAQGFAHAMRDDFCVVNRSENGTDQCRAAEYGN